MGHWIALICIVTFLSCQLGFFGSIVGAQLGGMPTHPPGMFPHPILLLILFGSLAAPGMLVPVIALLLSKVCGVNSKRNRMLMTGALTLLITTIVTIFVAYDFAKSGGSFG
jgi:hypothetical protein